MFSRLGVALLMLLQISAATAQIYNPASPTGPAPILPATPPQATPGMGPIPPSVGESSRTDQGAMRPRIGEGSPARETSNDRAIRCSHQAAVQGLPAGAAGQYTRECINSR